MRAIVLKARQIGFSTWTQAKMIQHVTQTANADALAVAHDMSTAQKLFRIGYTMWQFLPPDPELGLKPQIKHRRAGSKLEFGNSPGSRRTPGDPGSTRPTRSTPPRRSSRAAAAPCPPCTARRSRSGTTSRASSPAYWSRCRKTPTRSSSSNRRRRGSTSSTTAGTTPGTAAPNTSRSSQPWFEEPSYTRPFLNEAEREEFILSVGKEAIGQDEPGLIERFGLSLRAAELAAPQDPVELPRPGRQVQGRVSGHPRRGVPVDRLEGVRPGAGRPVVARTEKTDPRKCPTDDPGPEIGRLEITKKMMRKGRHGMVEVPTEHRG
jgi:hypothetical protein